MKLCMMNRLYKKGAGGSFSGLPPACICDTNIDKV